MSGHTEKWKAVSFDFTFTNKYRLEVSNLGNLRAFNKFSPGEPLKGSTINGYRVIRLKLYRLKNKKVQAALNAQHQAIVAMRSNIRVWQKESKKNKLAIVEGKRKLKEMGDTLRIARRQDIKNRTQHYHALFHRLVAEYFLQPKSANHTVVGHLDYDKMNNKANNLAWMKPEENYKHQQLSPNVIKEKRYRVTNQRDFPRGAKLSVEQVAKIKKGLAEGKRAIALAQKYGVTHTQIMRIKRGENWAHVKKEK